MLVRKIEEAVNKEIPRLSSQLEQKANYYNQKWYKNDFILYVSYLNSERKLYVSQDGINIKKIDSINLEELWDISCTYYNGYYYIIGDIRDENFNDYKTTSKLYDGGGNRIPIYKTKDFLTFEKKYVDIPLDFKQTWAPDWVTDKDGNLYITVSMADGSETYDWLNSTGVKYPRYKKYIYLIKCNFNNDNGFFNYENPIKISLTDNDGTDINDKIDSFIFYDTTKNSYYLTVKQRNGQYVQLYKSSSLTSGYTLIKEFNNIPQFDQGGEGSSIIKFKDMYYLYIQSTNQAKRYNYVYITNNLDNIYGKPFLLNNDDNEIMMHFTPIVVSNSNAKSGIATFLKNNSCNVLTDNKSSINGRIKVLKNDENGYVYFTERDNICELNFKIKKDLGFSNYDELFTLPIYPLSRLDFFVGVSENFYDMETTSPSGIAHLFINEHGVSKIHFNKNDTALYKYATGNIVFFKNGVYNY